MLTIVETTSHPRGTLQSLLQLSYQAFHSKYPEYEKENSERFSECDSFFYDNPHIGNSCAFITEYHGKICGMCSWDPRHFPEAIIGHNCIIPELRGLGLGKEQLGHAIVLLKSRCFERVIVSTGLLDFFIPAQRMYQSLGFEEIRRDNLETSINKLHAQMYYRLEFQK